MTETKEVKIFIGNLELNNYDLVEKNKNMKTFVESDTETKVSLQITIKNLEVKYLPTRYDKLVLIPDKETFEWIEQWEEHAKKVERVEKYTRQGSFSCRPSSSLKEQINKTLKEGDIIDIVVTYNGISSFQDKWYANITLQQFRHVKTPKKKTVNLFVD